MKEVKGSYLLWGTITIYLLYLFFDFMGVGIKEMILGVLVCIGLTLGSLLLFGLLYTQFIVPIMYSHEMDKSYQKQYIFKTFYLCDYCTKESKKYIRFSLIYWIIVIVLEVNNFCNKYFTFKL